MSFLTPPPEFDECIDATGMLTNNHCTIQDIFYPSPSSSSSHLRSGSYSPHSPCQQDPIFMEQEPNQQPLFPENNTAMPFDGTIPATQPGNMYNLEAPFGITYEPTTSWSSSYPALTAQYPSLHPGHEEQSNFFSSYPQPDSLMHSMLPPTPQPVTPNGYNFARANDSASFLNGLQQRTQQFTPDASTSASMSISSRSCSPNPSYGSMNRNMQRRSHQRSGSIASASSPLSHYGIPVRAPGSSANSAPQAWKCAYPNCTSRATFIRGCDLRKHYNRHSKHLFCRVAGCPQSEAAALAAAQAQDPTCQDPSQLILSGGFSSKKDRARHEAKHNPGIKCEWQGPDGEECERLFSRMDNMKDHVRRIHHKGQASPPAGSITSSEKSRRLKKNSR